MYNYTSLLRNTSHQSFIEVFATLQFHVELVKKIELKLEFKYKLKLQQYKVCILSNISIKGLEVSR